MNEQTITLSDKEEMRRRIAAIELPYVMAMCDPYILGHAGLVKTAQDIADMMAKAASDYIVMGQGPDIFKHLFASQIRFKLIEALVDDQDVKAAAVDIIRRDDFMEALWPDDGSITLF